ncbi:MAG: hypothetical protein EZS28_021926, partial [Streblomastix strix]
QTHEPPLAGPNSQKEEDKPADGYRHLIKHYLSPFLKERGYTIAQIYSVIGEQRDNQMMRLIQIDYAAFWNNQLEEIPDDSNDNGDEIFAIPTEQDIKEAKQKRDEKRAREQRSYETDMAKIKARKKPIFTERMTFESARLAPCDFQDDLDDYKQIYGCDQRALILTRQFESQTPSQMTITTKHNSSM